MRKEFVDARKQRVIGLKLVKLKNRNIKLFSKKRFYTIKKLAINSIVQKRTND